MQQLQSLPLHPSTTVPFNFLQSLLVRQIPPAAVHASKMVHLAAQHTQPIRFAPLAISLSVFLHVPPGFTFPFAFLQNFVAAQSLLSARKIWYKQNYRKNSVTQHLYSTLLYLARCLAHLLFSNLSFTHSTTLYIHYTYYCIIVLHHIYSTLC